MTFQIGEKVVYPNHGVGTIENISSRPFGTQPQRFYLLRLEASHMTVMVPFHHADELGLRKITRNTEIAKVLNFLACGDCKASSDWKVRFKDNSDKMQLGSLLQIAEVFKILARLQMDKVLSFREKKMLDRARQMLISEISAARSLTDSSTVELLARSMSRSGLRMPEPI
jgi:CarD family transcriptional regulator